jgi:hypothetical protein
MAYKKAKSIDVLGQSIRVNPNDYISLTDMVKQKQGSAVIHNWLRNRNTLEYLGIWEKIHNTDFNSDEFDRIKMQAGLNSFILSVKEWTDKTGAIGIVSKAGRYGGTYAHPDVAFEFGMWISAEFKIYLVKEFQRIKEQERGELEWNVKRTLAKVNYHIHAEAIRETLIPESIDDKPDSTHYATEADILNVALFGKTARQWREENPTKVGNMRDYATITQLVCLVNLENLNAAWIEERLSPAERLRKLNQVAIQQMTLLAESKHLQQLRKLEGNALTDIPRKQLDSEGTN